MQPLAIIYRALYCSIEMTLVLAKLGELQKPVQLLPRFVCDAAHLFDDLVCGHNVISLAIWP